VYRDVYRIISGVMKGHNARSSPRPLRKMTPTAIWMRNVIEQFQLPFLTSSVQMLLWNLLPASDFLSSG